MPDLGRLPNSYDPFSGKSCQEDRKLYKSTMNTRVKQLHRDQQETNQHKHYFKHARNQHIFSLELQHQ